jgi:hypothetical protein
MRGGWREAGPRKPPKLNYRRLKGVSCRENNRKQSAAARPPTHSHALSRSPHGPGRPPGRPPPRSQRTGKGRWVARAVAVAGGRGEEASTLPGCDSRLNDGSCYEPRHDGNAATVRRRCGDGAAKVRRLLPGSRPPPAVDSQSPEPGQTPPGAEPMAERVLASRMTRARRAASIRVPRPRRRPASTERCLRLPTTRPGALEGGGGWGCARGLARRRAGSARVGEKKGARVGFKSIGRRTPETRVHNV